MDKYDEAVQYLSSLPLEEFQRRVDHAWSNPSFAKGGCLFQMVSPNGKSSKDETDQHDCGCLTTIKLLPHHVAYTEQLTQEIRADELIPDQPEKITVEMLPHFARWQRRIDEVLGRKA